MDLTFSADGRSFTGTATLYGVGVVYPGSAAWQATLTGTSTDPQGIALDTNSLTIVNNTGPLGGLPAGTGISVLDVSTNDSRTTAGNPYTGPVAGLQRELVLLSPDNINMTATIDNVFLHSGAGEDALAAHGGVNVLDGGTGSNFLVAGSGTDTFFVDDRAAPSDIWSTVVGFHAGDAATVWGVTPQDFGLNWADNQGAAGYTGLTLHATAAGKATASLTLAGYTTADLSNGRLTVSFGTDPASGSSYMYVHGNS